MLTLVFAILGAMSTGTLHTILGYETLGGSASFPAAFMCLALCLKKFGVQEARAQLIHVVLGMCVFSVTSLLTQVAQYEDSLIARDAVLMTGMIWLGGLVILSIRKRMQEGNVYLRCAIPVIVDIVIMTPVSLVVIHIQSSLDGKMIPILLATYAARILLPLVVLIYIFSTERRDRFYLKE
jgi:hypothetical protein